ncbi:hypothetical protein AB0A71_39145 [Kitasatospora aureofaciens]|uniref:hypothetical protein n=1 Tax=Kitasatospora aureofaciens TaxID=1894 RepID=UPI0033C7FC09
MRGRTRAETGFWIRRCAPSSATTPPTTSAVRHPYVVATVGRTAAAIFNRAAQDLVGFEG